MPPHVLEAIGKAGAAGKTHYIPNNGIPELRAALAEKVVRKNGIAGTTDEDVFLTNGAMHALYVTFGALLSPGDEVILPDPMWTEVAENIRLAGGVPVGVPLRADDDFAYDTAEHRGGDHAAHDGDLPQHAAQPDRRRALRADAARDRRHRASATTSGSSRTRRTRT